jgi:hypothetical protein
MVFEPRPTAHPKVRWIHEYWRDRRPAPDRLPGRQHIDPADFPRLLENIWLLDVLGSPPRFRFRLIGEMPRRFGVPAKVGDFIDQAPGAESPGALRELFAAVAERQPCWFRGPPTLRHESQIAELERIILPLARDGEQVDMMLCLTVFYGASGEEY